MKGRPWSGHRRQATTGQDATIEVSIERLAPGGDAVGRQRGGAGDGRTTFVPLAAPGERVQVRLVRQKARVAWGQLLAVHEPSAARVAAPCPLFGHCGGCQWQHVGLGAQRAAKGAIVARALGQADVPLLAPVEGGQGYRDRAHLVVGAEGQLGFRERQSHRVVDVESCLLLSPELARALGRVRASATGLPVGTEVDLQRGREGVHAAVKVAVASLPTRPPVGAGGAAEALARSLFAAWGPGGVVGVRVLRGAGAGGTATAGADTVDIAGPGEDELRIPAGAFAQVGRAANAALVTAVLGEVGAQPGAVLELYAGSGNFTRHLVRRASRVVACDGDGDAVARGRRNAPAASWRLQPPPLEDIDADTVLADPPRGGLDGPNFAAAVRARHTLVYVSCDPQTLGRDAQRLLGAGFVLRRAVALDLMPHTFHVEVVATFDRAVPSTPA